MKKFLNKKGFTLAELLVVVAIIAVLVAVAIPAFTGQTARAKAAVDYASLRDAYADCKTQWLAAGMPMAASEYTSGDSFTVRSDTVKLGDYIETDATTLGCADKDTALKVTKDVSTNIKYTFTSGGTTAIDWGGAVLGS